MTEILRNNLGQKQETVTADTRTDYTGPHGTDATVHPGESESLPTVILEPVMGILPGDQASFNDRTKNPARMLTRDTGVVRKPTQRQLVAAGQSVGLELGKTTRFQKGNRMSGKKPKLATLGIDTGYLDIKDEKYLACLRRAEFYLRRRRSEYASRFGTVSVGVNAMLGQEALYLAASKYMVQMASAFAGSPNAKMFFAYMDLSNKMSRESRACAESAWSLCKEENKMTEDQSTENPFLVQSDTDG